MAIPDPKTNSKGTNQGVNLEASSGKYIQLPTSKNLGLSLINCSLERL